MRKSDRRDAKEMGILLLIVVSILAILLVFILVSFLDEMKQDDQPFLNNRSQMLIWRKCN